ncbi:hypothetical protein HCC21_01020 [Streptococcus suis]|nr:hypothetical protein [Streptococcus suis]
MAIQTMEDAHTFHYFYVAQKFSESLTTLIGVQSGIEELRKSPVFDKRPKNAFARDVIADLLTGTNWQARFVGETTPHSTNFYYTSIFDALKKVCEVWDLEMQFFVEMNGNRVGGRYIDFKQRIGEAVGKRVVYGHNALQILQEVERTNIFTALVGRGKGEETGDGYGRKITFENVVWSRTQGKPVDKPKGQKYLELPLMTRQYGIKNADGSMRPKIGFVDFSEEENPEVLIERTYKALIDAARPQLTLKTSSVYLRGVKVGDTIRVVRHDKKLDYDTRVFEITFNRLNNQSSDIKLGDRIGESNEAKVQTIADKAVEQFITNEFSNFVQNLPDYLPSADGFNNNWYGTEDPTVKYPGKVLINDIWYKPDPEHEGHKIMLRWTGEVWEEILRTYDSEALRDRIAEDIAQVNQSMQAQSEEHDRQVADILSKTQSVEELANQAKTDAANAMARANQVKTEAIADARAQVATVSQALNTAKTDLQNQVNAIDAKAVKAQSDATALRTDLNQQAQTILAQAKAQTALTSRVTTVETLADGTRSTVAELSKTVSKATGDITSVTSRTKTVEDTLSQTRTQYEALSQTVNAQTGQIESINRKTADLQSGIDGVTERFENLKIGSRNYFKNSKSRKYYITNLATQDVRTYIDEEFWQNDTRFIKDYVRMSFDIAFNPALPSDFTTNVHFSASPWYNGGSITFKGGTTELQHFDLKFNLSGATSAYKTNNIFIRLTNSIPLDTAVRLENFNLYLSAVIEDYSQSDVDFESKIAEYKRTADQNYAGLQSTISTLDGKITQNKTEANQTATQLSNRLTSLETYKNAEGTRAQAYFEAAKTETAKQITAERTAITNNYVAKSTYDENVRGTTLKLNEIKTTADTAKQNLATYQNTVDRKLTELISTTQTLDGKINTASAKITQNANEISKRLTSTQVDKAITDKGYQTKSDVDSNITGRGYITSSALQPYALSTTVQNLVKETADSFSRTISETRALIPTEVGGRNYFRTTIPIEGYISKFNSTSSMSRNSLNGIDLACTNLNNSNFRINKIVTGNGYWTVSFFAQSKSNTNTSINVDICDRGVTNFIITPTLQKFSTTVKVDNWSETVYNFVDFAFTQIGDIKITQIMVEKGLVATDWSLAPEDLATVTALHSVRDTVDSHTRTIGAVGTDGSILDNISKVTQTAAGLVQEVSGTNGLKTQVSTLAGSYAIKNLTSSGKVLNQLNLNKDGSVKIDGSLVQITGRTYIQDGIISAAKIGDLDAGKIKTGTLDAARIRANSIDGSKIVFDQAFLNKMTANEALFKQLFAQSAFITSVQAVAVSAKQIAGGIAKALNGGMDVNFDESKINFYTNVAAIRRIYTGHPTQFIKFETEGNYSRTIIGSNRNGGEVFNSATFAGIVVENTNNINTEDNVRLYGDNTLFRHAQGDVGWNINSVTQRIVPANINAESEIWSKHFVAPDKNSKPVRLDTAVAALWDIWNHIIYNNFEFNAALRTHIKARRDNWKFELNL